MKVAIVTDWLTNMGGAERVVFELHQMFPKAPIYTSLFDAERMPLFKNADIRTSYIQKLPYAQKKHQLFPILRQRWFSKLDLSEFDLVISASGAEAKAVKGRNSGGPLHINYCHSPTHYYWVRPDEYINNPGFGRLDPIMRMGLKFFLKRARVWDYLAAQEPDVMVANSTVTKERIELYYNREADIVFPPVDVDRFKLDGKTPPHRHGFVVVGRQVHYKRIDLAVAACTRMNLPLKVIGFGGPEHEKLKAMAGPTVEFLTNVSDDEMGYHMHAAEAFIFPGVEDFGIVAVEAMAAGTPVIAYKAGGALDYVEPGKSGEFFERQNVRSLMRTLRHFDSESYNHTAIAAHARKFSEAKFNQNMIRAVKEAVEKYR